MVVGQRREDLESQLMAPDDHILDVVVRIWLLMFGFLVVADAMAAAAEALGPPRFSALAFPQAPPTPPTPSFIRAAPPHRVVSPASPL